MIFLTNPTVQAAWTSCKGLERLPVRSQTVSSVKLARDSFDSLLALLLKSEANVMKSSRNLDSSEETEVKVQSKTGVIEVLSVNWLIFSRKFKHVLTDWVSSTEE